jgi:hypothetical protein
MDFSYNSPRYFFELTLVQLLLQTLIGGLLISSEPSYWQISLALMLLASLMLSAISSWAYYRGNLDQEVIVHGRAIDISDIVRWQERRHLKMASSLQKANWVFIGSGFILRLVMP